MADYSGIASAGSSIAAGITSGWQQYEKDKEQQAYNDQMFDYLRTIPNAVPEDALAKYHKMNPRDKSALILSAQFRATQEAAKAKAAQDARNAEIENRQKIAATNASILQTAKAAAEPAFTGPREVKLPSGTTMVQTGPQAYSVQKGAEPPLNLTEEEKQAYKQTGSVPLRTSEKSFVPGKIPLAEDVDLDAGGRPLVDWERGTYKSGGKIKPITQAMLKAHETAVGEAQSRVPGIRDIDREIQAEQTKLAKGQSGRYTLFPGITVGTPREKVITELQARKNKLMALYGTPTPATDTAAAGATPAPTATPAPAAAPSATPAAAAAAPSAAPPGAPAAGRITVVSPDGQVGTIPAEQLPAAVAAGYRQQ